MPTNLYALFADDDPDDLEMVVTVFKASNPEINVTTAAHGQEIIERLKTSPNLDLPVIILLDYKMPDMNAPEILAHLLRLPACRNIPKFVWSAATRIDHAKECTALGATAYLTKPVNEAELVGIVRQLSEAASRRMHTLPQISAQETSQQ